MYGLPPDCKIFIERWRQTRLRKCIRPTCGALCSWPGWNPRVSSLIKRLVMVYRIESQAFDTPVNGCAIVRSDPAKLEGNAHQTCLGGLSRKRSVVFTTGENLPTDSDNLVGQRNYDHMTMGSLLQLEQGLRKRSWGPAAACGPRSSDLRRSQPRRKAGSTRSYFLFLVTRRRFGLCFSSEGIWRFMKESNSGTVNEVSPYRWLQIMPLSMSC